MRKSMIKKNARAYTMETSIVLAKGRLIIPTKLRKKYGIKAGTKIYFEEAKNVIKLFPLTEKVIYNNIGLLETKGRLLKIFIKEKNN
jgi:bifunctional DNA-binding transcriptional regulator/antitoxin component of YhaV-PrlF toxin-antitoxin module